MIDEPDTDEAGEETPEAENPQPGPLGRDGLRDKDVNPLAPPIDVTAGS